MNDAAPLGTATALNRIKIITNFTSPIKGCEADDKDSMLYKNDESHEVF